eukprot:UN08576
MVHLVTGSAIVTKLAQAMDRKMDEYLALFPKDWADEIRGIATTLDEDIGNIFLYNVAYELFGLCTSIVAQDSTGIICIYILIIIKPNFKKAEMRYLGIYWCYNIQTFLFGFFVKNYSVSAVS